MIIDVCSDLHIDQWWHTTQLHSPDGPRISLPDGSPLYVDWNWHRKQKKDKADILIIAGDTSNSVQTTLTTLSHAAQEYRHVLFVDGNHEHYNKLPYSENIERLLDHKLGNVVFLNHNTPVNIVDGVAFVGANGWYDWRCYENKGFNQRDARTIWMTAMNDFPFIVFDQGEPDKMADRDLECLAKAVELLQDDPAVSKIVMVTHTVPTVSLSEWKDDLLWNQVTPSFVNSQMKTVLSVDTANKISHWIYGHTHTRKTTVSNGVTFVNNCRGYPRENSLWKLQQIKV